METALAPDCARHGMPLFTSHPAVCILLMGSWAWSEQKTLHAMPQCLYCFQLFVEACETKPCIFNFRKTFSTQFVSGFVVSGFNSDYNFCFVA